MLKYMLAGVILCLPPATCSAGEATLKGAILLDDITGNATIPSVVFINPNDIAVELKFVILLKHSTSCPGAGTYPSCTSPPLGKIDQFMATDAGIQTVSIPATGQFS